MSTDTEHYVHWSHRNFTAGQWREAAQRYLELCQELNKLEDMDRKVDHDQLRDDFTACTTCGEIIWITEYQKEFSRAFANLWAIRALKGDGQ